MASTSSSSLTLSSSAAAIVDRKAPSRHSSPSSPQCVSLPSLPLPTSQNRPWKATAYCRKVARNVMAMATGEASTEVATTTEPPEFLKTVQETAIDRLPLIPGVLEVAGIGYTGWFAYKNLIYKPDREALLQKIKDMYSEIIGSSMSRSVIFREVK